MNKSVLRKLQSGLWPIFGLIIGAIVGELNGYGAIGGGIGAMVGFLILIALVKSSKRAD